MWHPLRVVRWPRSVVRVERRGSVLYASFGPVARLGLRPCGCGSGRARYRQTRAIFASIKHPVLVAVPAHGSAKERNYALASIMRLTMAKRSKVLRARRSMRAIVTTLPAASPPSIQLSSRRSYQVPPRLRTSAGLAGYRTDRDSPLKDLLQMLPL